MNKRYQALADSVATRFGDALKLSDTGCGQLTGVVGRESLREVCLALRDELGFEMLIEGRDWIKIDNRGATAEAGIWAGGDVTNLGLVTDAIGHGRIAAESIVCSFLGTEPEVDKRTVIRTDRMRLDHYEKIERGTPPSVDPDQRLDDMDLEVNLPFTQEQLIQETRRCMSCGYCFDCEKCWMFCQDQAVIKPPVKGDPYEFNLGNCTGCKKCAEECPCGFIDMV